MRQPELDGLRALAISMVLIWHYLGVPLGGQSSVAPVLIFGRTGVDLFFVLSGFLITRILLETRAQPGYFAVFYMRRALRILPPYLMLLAVYFIGLRLAPSHELFSGSVPPASYAIFLQNYAMAWLGTYGASLMAPTWSLAVEEQFYLLFPLLIWFTPTRRLPPIMYLLIVSAPIIRLATYAYSGNDWSAYVWMPARTDALAVGALIAMAWMQNRLAGIDARNVGYAFALLAFCIVIGPATGSAVVLGHSALAFLSGSTRQCWCSQHLRCLH